MEHESVDVGDKISNRMITELVEIDRTEAFEGITFGLYYTGQVYIKAAQLRDEEWDVQEVGEHLKTTVMFDSAAFSDELDEFNPKTVEALEHEYKEMANKLTHTAARQQVDIGHVSTGPKSIKIRPTEWETVEDVAEILLELVESHETSLEAPVSEEVAVEDVERGLESALVNNHAIYCTFEVR